MPRRIIDRARKMMKKDGPINVRVKRIVWEELNKIAIDHRITLGEAVELALNKAREAQKIEDQKFAGSPDKRADSGDE